MAKAKRRLILPDPLLSSTRKPGPTERKLPGYIELAAALRAKGRVSGWTKASSADRTAELQLRESLTRTLADHAYFGYIRRNSKLPQSHPKGAKGGVELVTESGSETFLRPNGTDWLAVATAPSSGNWSVIPKAGSRLLILDLDVAKLKILADGTEVPTSEEERYLEVRRSLSLLSELLSMDIRATYAQLSPSGGVHIFLLLPEGVDPAELPASKISDGMRSLAGIPGDLWDRELRGDIRSGASNGFILMAGSTLADGHYGPLVADPRWGDFKDYSSGRKLRLLELSQLAVDRLRTARALDLQLRPPRREAKPKGPALATENSEPNRRRELKPGNYSRLLKRLEADPPKSYHEARAQIYRALSCCGSLESIAELCRDAGYGRDSHRGRELTATELRSDMEAMENRGLKSDRCGSHCGSNWSMESPSTERNLELTAMISALSVAKLQSADPANLDPQRIASAASLEARAELRLRDQRLGNYGIYGRRNPRGFDYRALALELIGERSFNARLRGEAVAIAGYRLRALELAVGYFGPLFSAGASVAIAPASELMELFGWTRSQLREALRLLRTAEVLKLVRRQVSGRAPGYGPGDPRFYDALLNRKLRAAWGSSRIENSQGEIAFLGGFFDHRRGRVVRPDGSSYTDSYLREVGGGFSGLLQELSIELPRAIAVGSSVVIRYLRKSLERYSEVSSSEADAVSLLHGLQETLGDPADQRYEIHSANGEDLWTSAGASCEDRPRVRSRDHPELSGISAPGRDRYPPWPLAGPDRPNLREEGNP